MWSQFHAYTMYIIFKVKVSVRGPRFDSLSAVRHPITDMSLKPFHFGPTLTVTVFILSAYISLPTYAQTTSAVCLNGYTWMDNSLGQSPCVVASYLLSPCSGGSGSFVVKLSDPTHFYSYDNPGPNGLVPCVCNTVLYAMLYACAACQGAEAAIKPWGPFSANCTQSVPTINFYPEDVPAGTSVPAWAYLDVTVTGRLDINKAEQIASSNEPESTASGSYAPASTASTLSTTSDQATGSQTSATITSFSTVPTSSNTPVVSASKHKPNAALIGGVVGGVVGAILIGVAVFYAIHRHRLRSYKSMKAARATLDAPYPNMVEYLSAPAEARTVISSAPPLRLYDPDEPSTYPPAQAADGLSGYHGWGQASMRSSYQGRPEI
ncbi:hypothetical protein C2E23DRAFT_100523 [Lenzites betulinus]|nr:hypothetical protein C2E23DRAFT_100523 [Lenzites betulinus]